MKLGRKYSIIIFIIILAVILIGTSLFFILGNKSTEEPALKTPEFISNIQVENIAEKEDGYDIEVKYPTTDRNKINEEIKKYVDGIVEDFKSKVGAENLKCKLTMDYQTYEYNENIVSFKLDTYEFTGGTRENKYIETYIYNIYSNKIIGINDILTGNFEKTLSDICKEQLKAKMGGYYDETLVMQGAGPRKSNFEKCVLDKDSLIVFFEPYTVGPWDAGEQSCEINYSLLSSVLNESITKLPGKK